ncbi:hypothetical protein [Paenibacillus sp. FSL R5-0519]|uniref:hypothetical protein n=1 Tax=Paenibacillus sp. FSL R5-0519 TaxID=2921648 RepID=UPI0030D76899
MKIKKIAIISFCALALSSSIASAAPLSEGSSTYDENYINPRIYNKPDHDIVTPFFDGYVYTKNSETVRKVETWSLEHNNTANVTDTVNYAVSVKKSANISIGGEAEFKGLIAKATYSANASFGVDTTETVSITWLVPKGKWRLSAGSKFNKVVGSKDYMISGKLINSQPLTIDYTFQPYSDKQPM